MQAKRHEIVHHVVVLRNRGKNLCHLFFLGVLGNFLKAKVRRLVAHACLSVDDHIPSWTRAVVAVSWQGHGYRLPARGV